VVELTIPYPHIEGIEIIYPYPLNSIVEEVISEDADFRAAAAINRRRDCMTAPNAGTNVLERIVYVFIACVEVACRTIPIP
jgi:hypothetical protein